MSRSRMLILPALVALALTGCGSNGDGRADATSAAPSSGSSSATAPASGGASAPAGDPTPLVETPDPTAAPESPVVPSASGVDPGAVERGDLSADQLDAVGTDQAVTVNEAASVQIGQMRSQELEAGPGEVGGAGVVVPVTVSNTSSEPLSLSGLVVTVTYGADGAPAEEVASVSDVIPASLAAGESQSIERAFTIPAEGRGQVRVVVDLGADYPAAVFEGPAPS
ncbi:hypothetical protein [Actinomyces bowdenii]|nr:hypothetical protein [Actinomyces bowdenii]